jgi:hypothetical protein
MFGFFGHVDFVHFLFAVAPPRPYRPTNPLIASWPQHNSSLFSLSHDSWWLTIHPYLFLELLRGEISEISQGLQESRKAPAGYVITGSRFDFHALRPEVVKDHRGNGDAVRFALSEDVVETVSIRRNFT